jgi:hypothetical protein
VEPLTCESLLAPAGTLRPPSDYKREPSEPLSCLPCVALASSRSGRPEVSRIALEQSKASKEWFSSRSAMQARARLHARARWWSSSSRAGVRCHPETATPSRCNGNSGSQESVHPSSAVREAPPNGCGYSAWTMSFKSAVLNSR